MAQVLMSVSCISEEICKSCEGFDPCVYRETLFTEDDRLSQNQIYCKNYRKCQKMYDYILRVEKKKQTPEDVANG